MITNVLLRCVRLSYTKLLPNITQHSQFASLLPVTGLRRISSSVPITQYSFQDTLSCSPLHPVVRHTVFTSLSSDQLWEGVTGPPGGTRRRARGKRRVTRPKVDLNRGQRLGIGEANIRFPGLNAPIEVQEDKNDFSKGRMDESYFQRLLALRTKFAKKKKRLKLPPLLRGWSGSKLNGQPIGPPTPELPDFDTRVIELKVVATMTATVGRYRRFSAVVATGNGQGLCGIGKAKAVTMSAALKRAKVKAAKRLVSFDLLENRTLWHVGFVHEWRSKIFAKPLPEGSGLTCHRLIRTLCQIIGVKDMYAKVEGRTKNYQALARGFLRLLHEQRTYAELANETGLNVVQMAGDYDMYPRVLASPEPGKAVTTVDDLKKGVARMRTASVQRKDEQLPILAISHPDRHRPRKPAPDKHESFLDDLVEMDEEETAAIDLRELIIAGERNLDALALGGRVAMIRGKLKPFYWSNPGNLKVAALRYKFRNHESAKREREVYRALDELHR